MADDNNEDQYDFKYDKYTAVTPSSIYAGEDALANIAGLVISFHHVPSGKFVFFKAFITAFNDTYAPDWTAETVYGRADPIYIFKNTTRKISLAFKVPAVSSGEAYENLAKVQQLVQFLYPTYTDVNNAATIAQSPLVRLKVMNLAQDASTTTTIVGLNEGPDTAYVSTTDSSGGLLGVINSVSVDHNLANSDAGVIEKGKNTILPKLIDISLDFSPIHEHPVGWKAGTTVDGDTGAGSNLIFASPGFPYMAETMDTLDYAPLDMSETMSSLKTIEGLASGETGLLGAADDLGDTDEEKSNAAAAAVPATSEDAEGDNAAAARLIGSAEEEALKAIRAHAAIGEWEHLMDQKQTED